MFYVALKRTYDDKNNLRISLYICAPVRGPERRAVEIRGGRQLAQLALGKGMAAVLHEGKAAIPSEGGMRSSAKPCRHGIMNSAGCGSEGQRRESKDAGADQAPALRA